MYSFDLKIRLVRYYNRYCKSIRKIALMFSVSKSSLSRWINNICLVRKQYSVRENVRILRFIKNSLNHNPFQTLRSLKERILKRLGKSYCLRTICRYINIIGYSKKKIVRKMYNGSLIDQQKKRKEFSKKIKKINKDDIICIDESYINGDIYSKYGYCKRNKRLVKNIPIKELPVKHSLLMAIDKNSIISYKLYKKQNINKKLYGDFLKEILKNRKNKYILMDNVSFHRSKEITKIIEDSNNRVLFIPPYSPNYNPIEEVFSSLKSFLKRYINPITINKDIYKLIKRYTKNAKHFSNYYDHAFN